MYVEMGREGSKMGREGVKMGRKGWSDVGEGGPEWS